IKIHIDNKSTICIVKNHVFHSKTKHIEIRHHFIRDSNEKKLIQMVKIHTDKNVTDLLTKAFDLKNKSFDEVQKAFDKTMSWINSFVPMDYEKVKDKAVLTQESSSKRAGDELDQGRSKKQKTEDDKEQEERKRCLEIIPDDGDDVTIDATTLSIKTSIIDYKIYKEEKKSFQIFRADGNSQMYLTFSKMLKNFDREDLEVLWRLVNDRFEKVQPVDDMIATYYIL
nr:putative ribonuclease H-like domain-containing protein [Tanacetum cinerariifolium]